MKIEHVAFQVADPDAMAAWYVRHVGFTISRHFEAPVPCYFLADSTGAVMIEIYRNAKASIPDYADMDPLHLHLAMVSEDVGGDVNRLVAAGATLLEHNQLDNGDEVAMLRDPWQLAIQLCRRHRPMVS
ncbi:MAG: VOC family protein [Phycisphaeraceae bacterium]|nr:VOC family protein [Phycisphaeraceae bacterium]